MVVQNKNIKKKDFEKVIKEYLSKNKPECEYLEFHSSVKPEDTISIDHGGFYYIGVTKAVKYSPDDIKDLLNKKIPGGIINYDKVYQINSLEQKGKCEGFIQFNSNSLFSKTFDYVPISRLEIEGVTYRNKPCYAVVLAAAVAVITGHDGNLGTYHNHITYPQLNAHEILDVGDVELPLTKD